MPRTRGEVSRMADRHTLALIAHDGRKADLVAWATYNRGRLVDFDIVATATTGALLRDKVGLAVTSVLSGPLGECGCETDRRCMASSAGAFLAGRGARAPSRIISR